RTGPVVRIDTQQRVVERRNRMDEAERLFAMPIVGWGLRWNWKHQFPAVARSLGERRKGEQCTGAERQHTRKSHHDYTSSSLDCSPVDGVFTSPAAFLTAGRFICQCWESSKMACGAVAGPDFA